MLKRHSITFHWLGDTGDCVYKSQMLYKPRVKPVRGKFPDKTISYLEMPKFSAEIYIGGVYVAPDSKGCCLDLFLCFQEGLQT